GAPQRRPPVAPGGVHHRWVSPGGAHHLGRWCAPLARTRPARAGVSARAVRTRAYSSRAQCAGCAQRTACVRPGSGGAHQPLSLGGVHHRTVEPARASSTATGGGVHHRWYAFPVVYTTGQWGPLGLLPLVLFTTGGMHFRWYIPPDSGVRLGFFHRWYAFSVVYTAGQRGPLGLLPPVVYSTSGAFCGPVVYTTGLSHRWSFFSIFSYK
ncbi:hypothetical protein Taro_027699, partial [Colocasia esculenta]|nr:hypothetical protein [Colocasia esculenta]